MPARTLPRRPQPPTRRSVGSIVGAIGRGGGNNRGAVVGAGGGRTRATEVWQIRGWKCFDSVSELAFGFNFMAENIGRIDPQIGVKTDGGTEPIGDGAGTMDAAILAAANQALDELRVGDDGIGGLVETMALNKYVAGEYWLCPPKVLGTDPWTVHSVLDARANPPMRDRTSGQVIGPGGAQITFEDGSIRNIVNATRVHKPHPAKAYLATGPLRALLDVAEEVEMLVRQIKAIAMSKLVNGLLVIPTELEILDGDGQPLDFGEELDYAMAAAIEDHGSTGAVKPMVARCPDTLLAKWQYITFEKGIDDSVIARLDNGIARLANGMPMPAEMITGLGTSTHWNARQITEDLYRSFVAPEGDWHYTRLLSKVIRPRVLQLMGEVDDPFAPGGMTNVVVPPEVADIRIWVDESKLISHPNKSAEALQLYGTAFRPSFGISGVGVRAMTGIPEEYAPDAKEEQYRLALAQRLNIRETLAGEAPAGDTLAILPDEGA